MLDNYEGDALKIAAGNIKQRWAAKGRQVLVECSGGVTEQNIESYFCDGKRVHKKKAYPDLCRNVQQCVYVGQKDK